MEGWKTTVRIGAARAIAAAAALLAVVVLSACQSESYENNAGPPMTITVSVFVGEDQYAVSPDDFGAGPARFIVTNQTGVEQKVTIATDRRERVLKIQPLQTAKVKMTLQPGYLSIYADKTPADAVEIEVGPKRPSADQELDQP